MSGLTRRLALALAGGAATGAALGLVRVPPARAGTLAADLTVPGTPGLAIGFDAMGGLDRQAQRAAFTDFARLGVRWLRVDLRWRTVQADGPDAYDWSGFDPVVALAREFDIQLLPVVGSTPQWAWSDPVERSAPADVADYARFLTAAVDRYQPLGISAWEIWNEPNMKTFWPPKPDPVGYARLLRAGYAAVKAADPTATVISGGLAPAPASGPLVGGLRYWGAVDFMTRVYAEAPEGPFDAVGFHPYSFPLMPDNRAGYNGWSIMTRQIRELMRANGDLQKRIWLTEYGAPTGGGGVTEDEQAAMVREAFALVRGYAWAGPLFWYSYHDLGDDPANKEDWFGLVRAPGDPKPAFDAFRAAAKP